MARSKRFSTTRADDTSTMLMRLAEWQIRRRANNSRAARKSIGITAAVTATLMVGAGGAYAYFTSSASGTASGRTASIVVTVSGTAPTAGGNSVHPGSVPGGTAAAGTLGGDLTVSVTNNNGYTLYVDSIQQAGLISASGGTGGTCPSDAGAFPSAVSPGSYAYVGSQAYSSYSLPVHVQVPSSGSAQSITIPNVVGMTGSSPSTCQTANLAIPVTVTLGTN